MPEVMRRVEAVRQYRLASKDAPTRKLADTPTWFHVENMPGDTYPVIPEVSSERRHYERYQVLVSLLPTEKPAKRRTKATNETK